MRTDATTHLTHLEEKHGTGEDAKVCSHRSVFQSFVRYESLDDEPKKIPRGINDLGNMDRVLLVKIHRFRWSKSWRSMMFGIRSGRLTRLFIHRRGTLLEDGLQGKRVDICSCKGQICSSEAGNTYERIRTRS